MSRLDVRLYAGVLWAQVKRGCFELSDDHHRQWPARCSASGKHGLRRRLDTEFVRTRTYYPAAGPKRSCSTASRSLIDPLTINDWAPMRDPLLNQDVTKYLHAGSEDLEVFLNAFNLMPQPLIDTQIPGIPAAAHRPGLRLDGGRVFGVALIKSESRTDWLARPLTERQCVKLMPRPTSGICCRSPAS
ncbi:hypothetical protein MJ579_18255 [Klebsiella pneumoniae]|nr:hypothetical protein MJ579_18255 [Klebsiella pneumoniae]